MSGARPERREQILQTLARELEDKPGAKLTTASLAAAVGVSEAALYRHFPSKARMFEALIEFAEDSVFTRVNRIMEEERAAPRRCELVMQLALAFAERNPGINRVIAGDALARENERVRKRACAFLERLETQLRQVLREANLDPALRLRCPPAAATRLLSSYLEGSLARFARPGTQASPLAEWPQVWAALAGAIFEQRG